MATAYGYADGVDRGLPNAGKQEESPGREGGTPGAWTGLCSRSTTPSRMLILNPTVNVVNWPRQFSRRRSARSITGNSTTSQDADHVKRKKGWLSLAQQGMACLPLLRDVPGEGRREQS